MVSSRLLPIPGMDERAAAWESLRFMLLVLALDVKDASNCSV
jgi:hypothetical protein